MAEIKRPTDNYKPVATLGVGLIVLTFGVMGIWAAFAPLGSAVIGHGTVAAAESRQTIQHLEGGIIQKINEHFKLRALGQRGFICRRPQGRLPRKGKVVISKLVLVEQQLPGRRGVLPADHAVSEGQPTQDTRARGSA
jgi:hypothetical protein